MYMYNVLPLDVQEGHQRINESKIKYFLFSVPYDSEVCLSNDNDKAFGDYSLWIHEVIDSGGLQSPVSGHGLLGTRPHSRRLQRASQ